MIAFSDTQPKTALTDWSLSWNRRVLCEAETEYVHTVTCMSGNRRGIGLEIGFIDHLYVVTTNNYNTIANFHTLQITIAHTKSFQCAVTSRFPVTDLNKGDSSASVLNYTD
jgi:hypothetical protein